MKKVLYISNIEVPYRTEFFNQLSKSVDLTVLYEREKSANRDEKWTSSIKSDYKIEYLNGIKVKNEYSFDLKILKYIFSKEYDKVIIGCYNSPSQILAILLMRIFRKKYILNLDGEYFLEGNNIKQKIKRFLIKGAQDYLIAGEKSGENLAKFVPKEKVHPYYFSSLTEKEINENSKYINQNINNTILVVGQYFDYKGLDIALECAKLDQSIKYKFVGSGKRSNLLKEKAEELNLKNVEIIPFLNKEELYKEYQESMCLLLPSRRECWGLVINEAASFGCPIISTKECGAAIEFLNEEFLANTNDPNDLYNKIKYFMNLKDKNEYKNQLVKKKKKYTIETSVENTIYTIYN